ncbi:MAG: DUF5752 family protein [Terriglobia bacterium]
MRLAKHPFEFMTAGYLTRICAEQAHTLAQLLTHLRTCSDDAIRNHTFQVLEHYHFLREGFSNDWSQWALAACNEHQLAEQFAALDIRQYESVAALRVDLVGVLERFVQEKPDAANRAAFEPFYFCEAQPIAIPSGQVAHSLEEFCDILRELSIHSLHYHFIAARLRPPVQFFNDFSYWVTTSLDLPELAQRIDQIDIYTNTLGGVRTLVLQETKRWLTP